MSADHTPRAEELVRQQLRTVLCELGLCDDEHASQRYQSTLEFARKVARDPDPHLAQSALNTAYERLLTTFQNGTHPKNLSNPLGYGRRVVQRAVIDELRSRQRLRDLTKGPVIEDVTGDLLAPPPDHDDGDDGDGLARAYRRELTRRFYAGQRLTCHRHGNGCPHPELVFSLALGTFVAELELDGVEGFDGQTQRRAAVLAAASPSRFIPDGTRKSGAQRQAGTRLWACRTELLRSVYEQLREVA